ncbi:hypothetical protein HQ587_07305 [bacterium]|nr:hypothetical protein [bacterium]
MVRLIVLILVFYLAFSFVRFFLKFFGGSLINKGAEKKDKLSKPWHEEDVAEGDYEDIE